jgi:adenylate cyclase
MNFAVTHHAAILMTSASLAQRIPLDYIGGMDTPSSERALLLADVTEFTQAMEATEEAMTRLTLSWVERCVDGWLAELDGVLLHQAGDALWLSFESAATALQAAWRLQADWADLEPRIGVHGPHELRIGLHWGRLAQGPHGYLAHSLNQLARMAQQAPAGQIWASAAFWGRLPPERQAQAQDLGWLHFKHLQNPLHVYGLGKPRRVWVRPNPALTEAKPRLLVASSSGADDAAWVDAQVVQLARNGRWVVAAWSMRGRQASDLAQAMRDTHADYLLVRRVQQAIGPTVDLLAAPSALLLRRWAGPSHVDEPNDPTQPSPLVAEVDTAIGTHAMAMGQSQPASALSPGLLSVAALGLMHQGTLADFDRARVLLDEWAQRLGRQAQPHVWQVLWQIMRHTRGLGLPDASTALAHVEQALHLQPDHAHAWAARGFALAHLCGDLEGGMRALEQAQALDPELHWAGLYRTTLWCQSGHARRALAEAEQALSRAPNGPLYGYALGLAGHAAIFAGQISRGIERLQASWRRHPHHSPTLRMLVAAHQMQGQTQMAKLFLRELLTLEPRLNARSYLGRNRAGHAHRAEIAHWLIEAGLPVR